MAEKYKATPNNPQENPEQDLKKQKQEETKENVKDTAKAAAKLYVGAHGGEAVTGLVDPLVDKVAENPIVNKALDKVSKNKQIQKAASQAKPMADMANTFLNAKNGGKGGGISPSGGGKSVPSISSKGSGKGMPGVPKTNTNTSSSGITSNNESNDLSQGNNPLFKNPLSNYGSGSKESTEIKIIKFLVKHPYLLVAIVILFLLLLIIIMFLGYNNSNSDSDLSYTYEQCKEITVVHADGTIEDVVPLEDYIMGVVNGEVGVFNDLETAKAIAVSARTYVVRRTDSCTKPAEDSSNFQEYNPNNISELTKQAVTDTAGEILKTPSGDFVSGEYDAFCYTTVDANNYVLCQPTDTTVDRLEIPKDWAEEVAASEGSSVAYLQDNSHGRGMSQFGAYYLSTVQKKDYKYILHYFYGNDVVISTMILISQGLVQNSSGFLMRTIKPEFYGVGNSKNNHYYYTNDNAVYDNNLMGECTWYAYGRINEILDNLKTDYNWTYWGNGGTFCNSTDATHFEINRDYTKPKVGAIFSKSGSIDAGHVGIIEDVDYDSNGNVVAVSVSEGGMNFGEPSITGNSWWNNSYEARTNFGNRNRNCNTYKGEKSSGCFNYAKKSIEKMSGVYCYVYLTDYKG